MIKELYDFQMKKKTFLAHLSPRLIRFAYSMGVEPASVSVCLFTLSSMNISLASGPITTKFYLKHYWGRENAV